ncbi:hypothetical protein REPUB_Repub04eG0238100 [Reevesia pubescens]
MQNYQEFQLGGLFLTLELDSPRRPNIIWTFSRVYQPFVQRLLREVWLCLMLPYLLDHQERDFLGEICNHPAAIERDPATIASVTTGILGGANIVRVHNIKDNVDAVKVCDAMLKESRTKF